MKTIKDIAKEARVSTGTVDRVLHNRSGVSIKTREKIQEILDKYDFQKNIMASALAYKKKFSIATLTPFTNSNEEFWHEPNRGIQTTINEIKKYGVEVHRFYFNQFETESFEEAFKSILELDPNAVLLAPVFHKSSIKLIKLLEAKNIPYVFLNIDIQGQKNISFIGQNSYQSGFLSAKILNLILSDKDDILIIKFRKNIDHHQSIQSRVNGFMDYFKSINSSRNIKSLNLKSLSTSGIKVNLSEKLNNELSKDTLIKGIFVPSSYVHLIGEYLEDNDLKEIKLIGYDAHEKNIKYLKNESIDFLIDQEPFEQGYKGVEIIFEHLFFKKTPKKIYNSPINIITKENIDYL